MSCFLSRHDHHPADLLDEYWFFSNSLNNNNGKKKPPQLPRSPSTTTKPPQQGHRRRLLRTPSLPAPRIPAAPNDDKEKLVAEVDDDDLNWSSIYEGVLRTRIAATSKSGSLSSALQRAPSMPVVPSSSDSGHRNGKEKENSKQQVDDEHQRSKHPLRVNKMMVRSKSTMFHEAADKKWKSSSDLETMEVQGFKDLGFVFDREELREDLADVLPGLNKNQHGAVRRPYLSEAWHHHRRQPAALIRVQSEARSAAEMKDQLRMWAQAVACNVRQECV